MRAEYLKIEAGTVHDPANGVDGRTCDVWIKEGKITLPPDESVDHVVRVIDARGLVVMPGGVDMHCHIVGPKVNAARLITPEQTRKGAPGDVPTTSLTGRRYAGMGYTTAFDAAIPPLSARHAHLELEDVPCIDRGFYTLAGNNQYLLEAIKNHELERARAFLGWLMRVTRAYAIKVVNPGGVEAWKSGATGTALDLDTPIDHFNVSPRRILTTIAGAVDDLAMPHAVHIHANNLGLPGNWASTLETMRLLEGRRGHLTHIQFHSYGGKEDDLAGFCSRVAQLSDYVNTHTNITVDVGQVLFGETVSMTADGPAGHYLARLYGTKWYSHDVELESGCGVSPIEYRDKSLVNAWQWAAGLEWYLLVQDPWRVAMSTDHPNGGSFLAYPHVIRLLMDSAYRREVLKTTPERVRERSVLRDLDREYSLQEIAIITRAGPARILGLANKGHLGPGADADITVYTPDADYQAMFELPRHVVKGGRLVIENGEYRESPAGATLFSAPEYDRGVEHDVERWFEAMYSVRYANYAVGSP